MSFSHDVVIAGGGSPGLTLALLLAQARLRVAVIDPAPLSGLKDSKPEGRTSALMQSSIRTLQRTGIWDQATLHGAPLEILRIIDDSYRHRERQIESDFPASDIGLEYFGVNIPNNVLRAVLAQAAGRNDSIDLHEKAALDHFIADDFGVTVHLTNNKQLRARLLVGADGRQSAVREQSNIPSWQHQYRQTAMTCLIRHTLPHHNVSTEFHRSGGPFTLVPMPGHVSSVVWVETDDDAEDFMKLSRQDFERALQDRSDNRLGRITLETMPQSCPLIGLRAHRLISKRVVLAAEAAHVLSPLGAQGLNLSLRDVDTLADIVIESARTGLDIGTQSVLQRYESARRGDILLRSAGTDGLTRFVSHKMTPLHELRRSGLRTLSVIEPLRHLAMQRGMAV